MLEHPWLVVQAPDIPLQSHGGMFFKSKESVATALAAGNRRLRAIELRPVSDALNPIMIRSKQRQISNSTNLPSDTLGTRYITFIYGRCVALDNTGRVA